MFDMIVHMCPHDGCVISVAFLLFDSHGSISQNQVVGLVDATSQNTLRDLPWSSSQRGMANTKKQTPAAFVGSIPVLLRVKRSNSTSHQDSPSLCANTPKTSNWYSNISNMFPKLVIWDHQVNSWIRMNSDEFRSTLSDSSHTFVI